MSRTCFFAVTLVALLAEALPIVASEGPYFVTYTHHLEEPGNLEIETRSVVARPSGGNRFLSSAMALEYGVFGWWTTELYLNGQTTANESSLFSGYRWENRFRPTRREHWINPVIYLEFENVNGAAKSLLEVVGHDGEADLTEPNDIARLEKKREVEAKLLLGSNWRGWNISENLIVEKNVAHHPWEFGYAVGISRPLAVRAKPFKCEFCAENFRIGVEAYGGLGDTAALNLRDTSHYFAPVIQWSLSNGVDLKASPSFGLSETSLPFFVRFGVSYEIPQFARWFRK